MQNLLLRLLAILVLSCGPLPAHPGPESSQQLTYPGGDGPGKGKHFVLIAGGQEDRSQKSLFPVQHPPQN